MFLTASKPKGVGLLATTATVVTLLSLATVSVPAQPITEKSPTPVIVELFTSEGCSDCPPADRLLSAVELGQPVPHVQVIALEEHVDYWNHGGWADPFSTHAFSLRQSVYSDHFGLNSVYTPQMIVDGDTQFVGGDQTSAVRSIEKAASDAKASINIMVQPESANAIPLKISVSNLPAAIGDVDVVLAVTENGLTSRVRGGENQGRTLVHGAVVREMRVIGNADAAHTAFATQVTLGEAWHRNNLNLVVFLQQRNSRRIFGAAQVKLT